MDGRRLRLTPPNRFLGILPEEYTRSLPKLTMPNLHQAKLAGDAIAATMAELADIWPTLSAGQRRRTLDEYAPRMTDLLRRHTAALAEEISPCR